MNTAANMHDNLIKEFITYKTVVTSFLLSGYKEFTRSLTPHIRCTRAGNVIYTTISDAVQNTHK